MTPVITGIPTGGHATRTIEFKDNYIYVSIGSNSNLDPDASRAKIFRSPISSLPIAYSNTEDFASGVRNAVGLRLGPDGEIWGVENGIDQLGYDQGRRDLGDIHVTQPSEELTIFLAENSQLDYGYPNCWSEAPSEIAGQPVSFPSGRGARTMWATYNDSNHPNDIYCRNTSAVVPPNWSMKAHSAPMDIIFASSDQSQLFDDTNIAIVTQRGSWNRPDTNTAGYAIQIIQLDSNKKPISEESLMWRNGTTNPCRPVGAGWANCPGLGACMIFTDDNRGQLVAIVKGTSPPTPPTPNSSAFHTTHSLLSLSALVIAVLILLM